MATSVDFLSWCKGHRLTILAAPPGWGKTSLLLNLMVVYKRVIVFVSPLKALSLEFGERLKGEGVRVFLVSSRRELREKREELLDYQVVILSYEHLVREFVVLLEQNPQRFFLVFDEFHLLFHWGESFRPLLWESFYQLAETRQSVLALSATVSDEIFREIKEGFQSCFKNIEVVDQGNFKLQNLPSKIYRMRGERDMLIHLKRNLNQGRRCLVFLPYRHLVDKWAKYFSSCGWMVLSCVGGETLALREALGSKERCEVNVIFSTCVLSHGVNLPSIHSLFIAYQETNKSLWLQMVGRGGRRKGESYILYCMNFYGMGWWRKLVAWLRGVVSVALSWQRMP